MIYDEKKKKLWKNFILHQNNVAEIIQSKQRVYNEYKTKEELSQLTEEDLKAYEKVSLKAHFAIQNEFAKVAEIEFDLDMEHEPRITHTDYFQN